MTLQEVMAALESMGTEQTKKTWKRHGAQGEFWGVKVGDMKLLQKKIKHNHELALALYNTGNADAMYFAGLISEPKKMTKADLQHWADTATWYMLSEYTVAWASSESRFGHELALEWIRSDKEQLQSIGWSTYACLLALKKDDDLDTKEIKSLMQMIEKSIHQQANRVRYTMNVFVISVGTYCATLLSEAKQTATQIGNVTAHIGDTACKVPNALAYIEKVEEMGRVGKKRKTVFC